MAQITINEGLAWLRTLKKRHEEPTINEPQRFRAPTVDLWLSPPG